MKKSKPFDWNKALKRIRPKEKRELSIAQAKERAEARATVRLQKGAIYLA